MQTDAPWLVADEFDPVAVNASLPIGRAIVQMAQESF